MRPAVPVLLLTVLLAPVSAQDYSFSVPEMVCNVSIERDRSLEIYYEIDFSCDPGAHPIDVVDIGMPSEDHDPGDCAAEIDGHTLTDIRRSTWVDAGVEVHLGSHAIRPGESGTFRFSGTNGEMVFLDSDDPATMASVEFTPTWFDGSAVHGTGDLVLRIQFPEGAGPEEVRHHGRGFTDSRVGENGRVVYEWAERWNASGPFQVGVSFPAACVSGPLYDRPAAVARRTRSGGGPDLGPLLAFLFPVAFILLLFSLLLRIDRARKRKYLPPKIGVEGIGIKRGLTAPMAALLMELGLDLVIRLVIFGMVLKGILEAGRRGERVILRVTGKQGDAGSLRPYEKALLDAAICDAAGVIGSFDRDLLRRAVIGMIEDLNTKMKGFSRRETRDYYESIVARAWKAVRENQSSEAAAELVQSELPWLMMDEDFEGKVESLGPLPMPLLPVWGGLYTSAGAAGGTGFQSIAEFCGNIASSLEGAADSLIGSLGSFTSSVTAVTNPIPASGGRSYSGGSSCACACACAGCACACAGGGR
ncbi:hypothetical protein JW921_08015 [Candidatus Fermentibacterales bacterium]|nr:hypothetical protein [Candidatus Fermentibacterales bacterium]